VRDARFHRCVFVTSREQAQMEQQRLLAIIAAAGHASAADGMDWIQAQPLDLLRLVSDVACSLHRCCGGCRPKQVAGMLLSCVKAIVALFKKIAQQHYDRVLLQVECRPP
jgi:hypothetical protein